MSLQFPTNPVAGQAWPPNGTTQFRYTNGRGWLPVASDQLDSKVLGELKERIYQIADGASVDIDPANGPIQTWVVDAANRTPTAINFESGQSVCLMILPSSGYTVDFTSVDVNWVNGIVASYLNDTYTVVELWKVGAQVYGTYVGQVNP